MKRFFPYLILFLCLTAIQIASAQTQQYYNMTTGMVNNTSSTLIPILQNDDTWTVCQPGGNYLNPADYYPVPCVNPYWNYPWPILYTGATTTLARWLSPYVSSAGYPTDAAPAGFYYYKMKFFLPDLCNLTGAHISLSHIGGDNEIDKIYVNNIDINIAAPYGANSVVGPAAEPVAGYLIPNAINEVIIRVENYDLWTGMQIVGNLVVTADFLSPSFCLSTNNFGISGSANFYSGNHTWEVYSSPTGAPASFEYIGTYTGANLNVVDPGACYKVKHTVETECGTACEVQTICKKACTDVICTATAPTGLTLTSGSIYSWNPVSGASSYELEISPNDPNCCGGIGVVGPPIVIPTTNTSYNFNNYEGVRMKCVRFRVKAFCSNGTWAASEWKCYNFGIGKTGEDDQTATTENITGITSVELFPNPTKGMVSISIETLHDMSYTIGIYDINGKLIRSLDPGSTNKNKATINYDASTLSKGIYLVKIITSTEQVVTKKLVIE